MFPQHHTLSGLGCDITYVGVLSKFDWQCASLTRALLAVTANGKTNLLPFIEALDKMYKCVKKKKVGTLFKISRKKHAF